VVYRSTRRCSVNCQIFPRCPQRADNTVKVPMVYGHRHSLILNVPTRWGTTVGLMNSVLKNEEAIMRYARQPKPGIDSNKGRNTAKILPHLKNPKFWTSLEQARDILEPLHQTQYLSEAEDYSLSRVLHNWNKIRADLYSKAKKYPHIECLKDIADDI